MTKDSARPDNAFEQDQKRTDRKNKTNIEREMVRRFKRK